MQIPIYQIDAFAARPFAGNPAAVCPLDAWLPDDVLQAIALENNLSETAFLVPLPGGGYHLRWFTPTVEVPLCGHATLASAHLLLNRTDCDHDRIAFETLSGRLDVWRVGDRLAMELPADPPAPVPAPEGLAAALGQTPREVHKGRYWLVLLEDETAVRDLAPDIGAIGRLEPGNLIVTAPGREVDFVSRFFAPGAGVPEDPVTGSAHCILTPFWAERLGRERLTARQLSARGGELVCELKGDRVVLSGVCAFYMEGRIELPD